MIYSRIKKHQVEKAKEEWGRIAEMRALLRVHYKAMFRPKWLKERGTLIAWQGVRLPKEVQDILRAPRDEDDPVKLEQLRTVIVKVMEGHEHVLLETSAHVEEIARSVETCERRVFVDELGADCRGIPAGSRLVLSRQFADKESAAGAVRQLQPNTYIEILTRPFDTERSPPVSAFGRKLSCEGAVAKLQQVMEKPQILDRMLLCLHHALLLKRSDPCYQVAADAKKKIDEDAPALEVTGEFEQQQASNADPLGEPKQVSATSSKHFVEA